MYENEGRDAARAKPQLCSIKTAAEAKQLSKLGGGNNDTNARRLLMTLQCAVPRPHRLHHTNFFPSRQPRAASKAFRLIFLA